MHPSLRYCIKVHVPSGSILYHCGRLCIGQFVQWMQTWMSQIRNSNIYMFMCTTIMLCSIVMHFNVRSKLEQRVDIIHWCRAGIEKWVTRWRTSPGSQVHLAEHTYSTTWLILCWCVIVLEIREIYSCRKAVSRRLEQRRLLWCIGVDQNYKLHSDMHPQSLEENTIDEMEMIHNHEWAREICCGVDLQRWTCWYQDFSCVKRPCLHSGNGSIKFPGCNGPSLQPWYVSDL